MLPWHFHFWNACLVMNQKHFFCGWRKTLTILLASSPLLLFLISHKPKQNKQTNVRKFPTRRNFQILNVMSSFTLRVISFYFPPLEVVHPVAKRKRHSTVDIWKCCSKCSISLYFILSHSISFYLPLHQTPSPLLISFPPFTQWIQVLPQPNLFFS